MSVKAVTLNHLAKRKDLQKILTTADLHTGNLQAAPAIHARGAPDDEGSLLTQVHNHTRKVEDFTSSVGHIISHIDSTQKTNINLAI
jgi:methylthioribose-1-phosphate isomerase